MHTGNHLFLAYLKEKYLDSFVGAAVLELGSLNICGSVRPFFEPYGRPCGGTPSRYVGVDIISGPGVDLVTPAMHTIFEPNEFDTMISFSMFEHDPTWEQSYLHNLQWLKPGGMIFLCWGAEGNAHHPPEPFAIVPVAQFNEANERAGCVDILDQFFEMDRFQSSGDCPGCYDVVARKR